MATAVAASPERAVGRRSLVVYVPAILRPFINVAVDLIEAPWIGLK